MATDPTRDRSAPGVRVTALPDERAASGAPVDLGGRVLGLTYEDSERKADKVSLQLDNHDLALFEREELMGGSVLEVSWGYPGDMAPPRRVVVKRLKGFTALTIEGQALSVLMDREARTRRWEHRTRAEVVREIAREHGYEGRFADVEETAESFEVINQAAETDARFLRRLAAREEFEFYVDDGGLHFHERRQGAAPIRVFTWVSDPGRGDVLSINVESDLVKRAGKVTVKGRDPMTRTTFGPSSASANTARATLGETVEVVDPETGATSLETRNATTSVHPTASSTMKRAEREAAARFRAAERSTVKLSMQVVGDPTLRAKTVVEVRGVTPLLSGKYYVTEVKHVLTGAGYTCELKLTRDGIGRLAGRTAQAQQGERNRAVPRTDGEITQLEVVDPETGGTRVEYRQDGGRVDLDDPGAR
jgi:hypothetical protein